MAHDLVITGGTIVDGTGAPPFRGDVAIDGDRVAAVGEVDPRCTHDRRCGANRGTRFRRWPHAPRRAARVGPDRLVVVLARRHVGRARQLRCDLRPVPPRRPAVPRRADGVGGGHPRRQHPRRPPVGLGDATASTSRRSTRSHGASTSAAWSGTAQCGSGRWASGPRSRGCIRRRHRGDGRDRRRGHGRRRDGVLDLAHAAAPRSRWPAGSGNVGRTEGAPRDRRRARAARAGRVRGRAAARRARCRLPRRDTRRGEVDGGDQPTNRPTRHVRARAQLQSARSVRTGARLRRRGGCRRRGAQAADHRPGHRPVVRDRPPHAVRRLPVVAGAARAPARRTSRCARRPRLACGDSSPTPTRNRLGST